ncbi:MAG TPA: PTS sugar transporter subunit IIC [Gemmatimonadales bacterium]|nr:PTS sugar transporter subunit IIC [Gemmatimonadales bacterium]
MSFELQALLLVWGMLVGLDLVSVPQVMIARPLVAGAVAGAMLGDIPTGLQVGVVFELFQHDILPMGAVRYPEYGPATVAAVSAAHATSAADGFGLGVIVGLITAILGGSSIHLMRRVNAYAVRRAADALDGGDVRTLVRLHVESILRDAARAAIVTAIGLGFAAGVSKVMTLTSVLRGGSGLFLAVSATAAALAVAAAGTLRLVRGPTLAWFAAGLLGGAAGVWLR